MAHVTDFLSPADLQKITHLQVLARQVVEGLSTGLHRSPHKGFSVEFKQHRPYVPGDEIRHIDWRVFGRSDRYYIREYEEETNLRATLLLDLSGSMDYGRGGGFTKWQYATRLAACLTYLMLGQQDSVGLVTFDTKVRRYIPPRSRVSHLRVLMDELERVQAGRRDGYREGLPRSRAEAASARAAGGDLRSLRRRHFAAQGARAFPPRASRDPDLPDLASGRAGVSLSATGRSSSRWRRAGHKHLLDPAMLRHAYLENLAKFRDELTRGCRRHKIDLVPFTTDQPYAEALAYYLSRRAARA